MYGDSAHYGGILFSPNGNIDIRNTNSTFDGSLVANIVELNGANSTANNTLSYDAKYFTGLSLYE